MYWKDVIGMFAIFFGIACGIICLGIGISAINYNLNKANVCVSLDGNVVYEGKDRSISYFQLGEYGKTYKINISKDGFWNSFKTEEVLVGKNLKVEK